MTPLAPRTAHMPLPGASPRPYGQVGGEAVAGFLLEQELRFLCDAMVDPEHPFVAVIGGGKISSKIDVIEALLPAVDRLLIGGAMANTFFQACGWAVGDSLVEEDRIDTARSLMDLAGDKLLLPVDVITAPCIASGATTRVSACDEVREGERIGDIGPAVGEILRRRPSGGPHRDMEWPDGRLRARAIPGRNIRGRARRRLDGRSGRNGHHRGGDSAAAAVAAGVVDRITHVSTGGSASLELLSGKELPGVAALSDR